jgi:uncharacterized protein
MTGSGRITRFHALSIIKPRMFMKYRLLIVLALLPAIVDADDNASPAPTVSASFDCKAAQSSAEKMICADAEIADSDRRMGMLFAELQRELPDKKKEAREEQRKWLKERDACDESSCLRNAYDSRIGEILSAMPSLASKAPISAATADQLIAVFAAMTPEDLENVTTGENGDALNQASCFYFQRSPRAAAELFRAFSGSTRDARQPLCQTIDIEQTVPAVKGFIAALEQASAPGHCFGTMMYGEFRMQWLIGILAVVDADPDIAAYEHSVAHRYDKMNYQPDLAHWAQQGLWEKRIYAEVQRTLPLARDGMRDFYVSRFHLDAHKAARVADYYVQQMMDVYIRDQSGFSSTLSYASLCLDKDDLDRYLADGKMPERDCPYKEFVDTSEPQTLRRLLGLAIVDDYPLDTIKRLIKAGAALEVPKEMYGADSSESLLMMAAARPDAIDVLLAAGADANKRNWFGKTPLMYAVAERNLSGVQALLRAGAEVDAATAPLDKYCTNLKAGGRTVLMYAAWHGNAEIVRSLIAAHSDAGAKDSNGETAAEYISKNTDVDAAERERIRSALQKGAR